MSSENTLQASLAGGGLAVTSVSGKGRALVTTRHFSQGDVIISQQPYACVRSKGTRCDGCFASNNIKKCSGCQVAWYCGSSCQRSEWKLHQVECKVLAELSAERKKALTGTVRLMVKLMLRKKLQSEQIIPETAFDNYELVNALESHINKLGENQLVLYAQMANLVKLVLPSIDIDLKEVTHNFSRLSCNAHTICDSELRPIGTGLYPVISIINHSCAPNSVLVFEGQTAYVRALEPLPAGTEILISYIETAASTKKRQKDLVQYFFTCTCPRCTKSTSEDLHESALLEGYRCKDSKCQGILLLEPDGNCYRCQQCSLTRDKKEIQQLSCEVSQAVEKGSNFLSSGNLADASAAYKNVELLQQKLCHPFALELMRTRETLLKVLMKLNQWTDALEYCYLLLPVYQRIYPATHPLLGLHYYTCGKLEWLFELTEDALRSFLKAADILRVTHGSSSSFMRELFNRLEEAQAEAFSKKHQIN